MKLTLILYFLGLNGHSCQLCWGKQWASFMGLVVQQAIDDVKG